MLSRILEKIRPMDEQAWEVVETKTGVAGAAHPHQQQTHFSAGCWHRDGLR
jgi:hypothetical protein